MVSSRKLSSDEVEALIDGLQDQPATTNASVSTTNEENVRPFDFGSDDLSLLGDYYALRMLNERQRANLDILESNEAPRPASPTRQDVSEADVTPAKIAPVSRISAAVRAEDRRKAEKVRASAVFSALGDGSWVSESKEVAMEVEKPVEVKAEEAPVQLKGSVRFEIKTARAAPTRPALDAFSQIEDIVVEAPPPRAPAARPRPPCSGSRPSPSAA